jgi:predicted Rossmann-fold nucleotide-binding protein
VLPGDLGTLDEMCEILTWAQLGIHDKPVVLINIAGYGMHSSACWMQRWVPDLCARRIGGSRWCRM